MELDRASFVVHAQSAFFKVPREIVACDWTRFLVTLFI